MFILYVRIFILKVNVKYKIVVSMQGESEAPWREIGP